MGRDQEAGLVPRKSLNDVYIEDAELRLDPNGPAIDCMRRLAANRKEWRNVTRRSCIIQSNDSVGAD